MFVTLEPGSLWQRMTEFITENVTNGINGRITKYVQIEQSNAKENKAVTSRRKIEESTSLQPCVCWPITSFIHWPAKNKCHKNKTCKSLDGSINRQNSKILEQHSN